MPSAQGVTSVAPLKRISYVVYAHRLLFHTVTVPVGRSMSVWCVDLSGRVGRACVSASHAGCRRGGVGGWSMCEDIEDIAKILAKILQIC